MAKRRGDFQGTQATNSLLSSLLVSALGRIGESYNDRPDLIMASWPEIIGAKLAPMTEATSFEEGVLTVKVKNSTLHSLLSVHEKPKLLKSLKEKFPSITIRNIIFKIG
jgi:hypothetical protein